MAITSMGTEAAVATTTMVVAAVEAMATVADDGKFSSQICGQRISSGTLYRPFTNILKFVHYFHCLFWCLQGQPVPRWTTW